MSNNGSFEVEVTEDEVVEVLRDLPRILRALQDTKTPEAASEVMEVAAKL